MNRNPKEDPIPYLVRRKFPEHLLLILGLKNPFLSHEELVTAQAAITAYTDELKRMSKKELQSVYKREKAKAKQDLEQEEQQRLFNQPAADADFVHWSKAAYWTLEEAIALSFGKSPKVVDWERVSPYVSESPFAKRYERARDLALRANKSDQLGDPVSPELFLAWAKHSDLEVAVELLEQVKERDGVFANWKDEYDELMESTRSAMNDLRKELGAVTKSCRACRQEKKSIEAERDSLKTQISELKSGPGPRAESTYQNMIAALLECMLGEVTGVQKHPSFANEKQLIKEIADHYQGYGGLSESTLSRKFPEAKRALKSR